MNGSQSSYYKRSGNVNIIIIIMFIYQSAIFCCLFYCFLSFKNVRHILVLLIFSFLNLKPRQYLRWSLSLLFCNSIIKKWSNSLRGHNLQQVNFPQQGQTAHFLHASFHIAVQEYCQKLGVSVALGTGPIPRYLIQFWSHLN